jgi:hypothetical protein
MATQSFKPTATLARAISRVMESNPKDWGYVEHMTMVRYLCLEASKEFRATWGTIPFKDDKGKDATKEGWQIEGKEVTEITVPLAALRTELDQAGKLAECANFKKWMSETYPQFLSTKERKAEYK